MINMRCYLFSGADWDLREGVVSLERKHEEKPTSGTIRVLNLNKRPFGGHHLDWNSCATTALAGLFPFIVHSHCFSERRSTMLRRRTISAFSNSSTLCSSLGGFTVHLFGGLNYLKYSGLLSSSGLVLKTKTRNGCPRYGGLGFGCLSWSWYRLLSLQSETKKHHLFSRFFHLKAIQLNEGPIGHGIG